MNRVHKNEIMDARTLASKLAQQGIEMEMLKSQLQLSKELGFNPDGSSESQMELLKEKVSFFLSLFVCLFLSFFHSFFLSFFLSFFHSFILSFFY